LIPSYSATDIGLAVATVILVALDVGSVFVPGLRLDVNTRTALMTSLTILATAGVAALIANHQGQRSAAVKVEQAKQAAAAAVAVAQAPTPGSLPPPVA
jgi:hypothetical protein